MKIFKSFVCGNILSIINKRERKATALIPSYCVKKSKAKEIFTTIVFKSSFIVKEIVKCWSVEKYQR